MDSQTASLLTGGCLLARNVELAAFLLYNYCQMSNLLELVNNPEDLKKLPVGQLTALAEEVRQFILHSVSKTGGHLASSLGVVELTVALHYVFDFSKDKLLWDVGHQCYAHKIITGRKDKFARIRQPEGLSGFPDPAESPYDQFLVGHAGTAVPTALGLALGQMMQKQNDKIVALVGDASIVNGLSFEALNNLGLVKRQMLIVLNDNSMAINPTQGALAKYFSAIRISQTYDDMRKTANNILDHTPVIGKSVEETIEKVKKSIRMTLPASQMFESLNIPYFGPVDGHDIPMLIKLFKSLANMNHPVMLHVYTKKGKGFAPAEKNEPKYHSTGPFNITNGDDLDSAGQPHGASYTSVLGDSLIELAQKDPKVVAITCAMCDGTGLTEFAKRFPDRFYDVGIAESMAVEAAAGLAKTGLRPFVCIYSTFLQRSFDQIFQEVALQNLPVLFCIDRAGLVGSDGPTHHGLMDIGFMRMLPNAILAAPANGAELKLALEYALSENKFVAIRYPKDYVPPDDVDMSACNQPFKRGKSVVVRQSENSSVAIVSYGALLNQALAAAKALNEEDIEVDVINARFASPIDTDILSLLEEGKHIVTIEDHSASCGFGSALLELAAAKLPERAQKTGKLIANQVQILGVPDKIFERNSRSKQLMEAGISADNIVRLVKQYIQTATADK